MIVNSPPSRTDVLATEDSGKLTAKASGSWIKWFGELYAVVAFLQSHFKVGTVSPNGAVTGSPGDLYLSLAGGTTTTLWVKESGAQTMTGWIGK